jgi:hypothetical protein
MSDLHMVVFSFEWQLLLQTCVVMKNAHSTIFKQVRLVMITSTKDWKSKFHDKNILIWHQMWQKKCGKPIFVNVLHFPKQ